MFRGCTFDNQNVTSQNDGGLYQQIFSTDGVIWGCSISATTNSITIQPGEMLIGGRLVWVDGATQIQFSDPISNGYGQVVLQIDLSQTATTTTFNQLSTIVNYSTTTLFPALTQEQINQPGVGTIYQAQLAIVQISGGNITGVTESISSAQINAETLGGKTESQLSVNNSALLNGQTASQLSVANSVSLGGQPADYYASGGLWAAKGQQQGVTPSASSFQNIRFYASTDSMNYVGDYVEYDYTNYRARVLENGIYIVSCFLDTSAGADGGTVQLGIFYNTTATSGMYAVQSRVGPGRLSVTTAINARANTWIAPMALLPPGSGTETLIYAGTKFNIAKI